MKKYTPYKRLYGESSVLAGKSERTSISGKTTKESTVKKLKLIKRKISEMALNKDWNEIGEVVEMIDTVGSDVEQLPEAVTSATKDGDKKQASKVNSKKPADGDSSQGTSVGAKLKNHPTKSPMDAKPPKKSAMDANNKLPKKESSMFQPPEEDLMYGGDEAAMSALSDDDYEDLVSEKHVQNTKIYGDETEGDVQEPSMLLPSEDTDTDVDSISDDDDENASEDETTDDASDDATEDEEESDEEESAPSEDAVLEYLKSLSDEDRKALMDKADEAEDAGESEDDESAEDSDSDDADETETESDDEETVEDESATEEQE